MTVAVAFTLAMYGPPGAGLKLLLRCWRFAVSSFPAAALTMSQSINVWLLWQHYSRAALDPQESAAPISSPFPKPLRGRGQQKGASSGHSFRRDPHRLNPTRVGNGRFAISQKTTDRRCVRCIVIVLPQAGHVHTLLVMSPQWCCGVVSGHVGAG